MEKTITIADWLLILVTFAGPIVAVQVQKWVERIREERFRRLTIFQTLMATRAMRASSSDHVQALNLIDVFFNGKSKKERDVRDAWVTYLDFFNQRTPTDDKGATAHNEKGVDLLTNLLAKIGHTLGYHFNAVQLKRGGYYPQGHADEANASALIRQNLVKVLTGTQHLKMDVASFPATISEEDMQSQLKLRAEMTALLSGDKPLRVKTET
jgi:hypothetical protein